ncbi:hypothetical protein BJV78DRAFT_1359146 [Lactifluus subvellereus]|nr:hypothetical protein BJV78DRAFT_1359146 [Lactifluus subvellereus]
MDFSRPRQLPTPPETDTDFLAGGHHNIDLNASSVNVADSDMNPLPFTSAPFRRVSTLAYHSSPLRDPRERASIRHPRWLVVVMPPASLVQEHGPFGHTLAFGPSQRLSQGILMPLLPTMYGQLTAIAREFNFPSSVGLCLYLQVVEQGFTMTPRISDEIWPALWSQFFEARSPTSVQLTPICGRIEFDIDRRKARWLDSWLNSDRRHAVDVPVSVPPSLSHGRGDSKNSFLDERGDERSDVMLGGVRSRHIPKKLSLLDKLETLSVTSSVANPVAGSGAINDLPTSLATVLQDNQPKNAKNALEKRVESWRASSSVAPTPMAATGQNSLDPVNIPNSIELNDTELSADPDDVGGLDLDNFAWSVSSMGPPDHDSLTSPVSSFHVPSVHLDRRLEGSILLSPSTATSWGPETLDYSPMSSPFRFPSPDIGQRVIEDCPPTPSTATSWGPEELLYSPESVISRLPSPDLGMRVLDDSPCTPLTVTTWDSPISKYGRSGASDIPTLHSNHVFPYFVAESCPAWTLTWPFHGPQTAPNSLPSRYPQRDLTIETYDMSGATNIPAHHSRHVFPYFVAESCPAWTLIWPFHGLQMAFNSLPSRFRKGDQSVETYDAAEEPATSNRVSPIVRRTVTSPNISNHPSFAMHHDYLCDAQSLGSVHLGTSYPNLRIYPPVYPYLCIYPPPPADMDMGQGAESPLMNKFSSYLGLGSQYPCFDLYPAGYPTNLMRIYPPVVLPDSVALLPVRLPPIYPVIEPYSPEYPFVTPYPPCTVPSFGEVRQTTDSAKLSGANQVQSVKLKGDPPLYPTFDIYPAVTDLDSVHGGLAEAKSISLRLPEIYPRITPYPTVYPEFDLYPSVLVDQTDDTPKTVLTSRYPCIRIYPIVYPHFEIYPGYICDGENGVATGATSPQRSVYPQFDIYPEVYPYFNLYGTSTPKKLDQPAPLSIKLSVQYPTFNLYPPIYPHFDIFPSVAQVHVDVTENRHSMLASDVTPSEATGEAVALVHTPIRRKVRRTHKELHEEVFGAGAPVEFVEQVTGQPLGGYHARSRVRSGTVSTHFTSRPLPPVPPLPISNRASPPITFPNVETQKGDFHVVLNSHSSPTDDEGSMALSNSLTAASSSPRKDHGRTKPSPRPRDSLVLEKARLIDQTHTRLRDDQSPSILGESAHVLAPPVPQRPVGVPRSQKLDLSKYPFS